MLFLSISFFIACHQKVEFANKESLNVNLYDTEGRRQTLQKIKDPSTPLHLAFNKLISRADTYLAQEPYSIVWNQDIAISGDPHDYYSLAPYWWPDSSKANGLPWIRKDGEINPQTKTYDCDDQVKDRFFNTLETLTWAYYYSNDTKYGDKLINLIDSFFIVDKTKMNPHLDFAQSIPGKNSGRWIGIIEFTRIADLTVTLQMLEDRGIASQIFLKNIKEWLNSYLYWLQHSDFGKAEASWPNNHGTWYDVQVVSLLIYLDRYEEARQHIVNVSMSRVATQITKDGSQPHELERTKSLSYSKMNLWAFTKLSIMAEFLKIDLFGYMAPNGASIAAAYQYLYPYAIEAKEWPYQQIHSKDQVLQDLLRQFRKTCTYFKKYKFCNQNWSVYADSSDIDLLIYP